MCVFYIIYKLHLYLEEGQNEKIIEFLYLFKSS